MSASSQNERLGTHISSNRAAAMLTRKADETSKTNRYQHDAAEQQECEQWIHACIPFPLPWTRHPRGVPGGGRFKDPLNLDVIQYPL